MSEMSEKARDAAKSKVARLVRNDPHARVDASGYMPDGAMNADAVTGERPISRRQFRRGGKVAGEASTARADRKPRANGGRALTADSLINRDVKEANKERGGLTHDGGMKRGGRAHKTMGGLALPNWADQVSRSAGGRTGKAVGGALSPLQRMAIQARNRVPTAGAGPPIRRPIVRADGGGVHGASCGCAKCGGGRVGRKDGGGNWIKDAVKHPGSLHRSLGVPQGQKIPAKKLEKAEHSENPKLARKARLAETLKAMPKKARGGAAINDGTRPVAGRLARKSGGRTKKGTNVNIIITQPPGAAARPTMPVPPPVAPVGLRQAAPPMAPPPGAMAAPPPGAAGMPPPMMGRKAGGRINDGFSGKLASPGKYPIDAGSGGGLGRLEKAERAARG